MKFLLALFLGLASAIAAEIHPVQASLICEEATFTSGKTLTLALRLQHQSHWHTYWQDPGDAGLPTAIDWKLPAGIKAGPLQWPRPETFHDPGGMIAYGYGGDCLLLTEIKIPASYAGKDLLLKATASWLVCKDVCIPGSANLELKVSKGAGAADSKFAALFFAARKTLGQAPGGPPLPQSFFTMLLLAFLGGLLLNLMPCVLPVLSLKVMAFVRQSGESRKRSTALGAAFGLGAIVSFWALAAVVLGLKAAGENVGWGFQFQNPFFVAAMSVVVLAFALNLFGVFEISLPSATVRGFHEAGGREGLPGAFFTGAFMTLLATPCTAPFLGTALGFAFSQSGGVLFAVFTVVGFGLAAPYMVLSAFPKLMRWVPKPGKWMLHFKQLMGFPLLATVLWLLWVLGMQTGLEFVVWFLGFLLVFGMAAWIYGAYAPMGSSFKRLGTVLLLNLLLLGGAYKILLAQPVRELLNPGTAELVDWEPYSAKKLAEYQKRGRTVFLDFSAEWCWTCKVNEKATLNSDKVKQKFAELKVVKMKADWTRRDEEITNLIYTFGRSGVPLYVLYPSKAAQSPLVLPEVITPDLVLEYLSKAEALK